MSENVPEDGSQNTAEDIVRPDPKIRLRIRPAVIVVLAQIILTYGVWYFGSSNIDNILTIGIIPLAGLVALVVWWLAASGAPWRDKLIGLGLFAAAIAAVVFSQDTPSNGAMLLVFALPALAIGFVAALAATSCLRWPVRRWLAVAFIAICAGGFSLAARVDRIGGNLVPAVSWRWQQTPEEHATGLARLKGGGTAVLPAQTGPEDWTGFRGPLRDGCKGGTFSTDWTTPPRELWRKPVGVGWSSFAVVGGYIFTQEQRGPEELVTCYRADTGENIWVNGIEAFHDDAMGSGPQATPTYDQGKLYTQGGTGILHCLDAATGKVIWKRDLVADAGGGLPGWGFSTSPLIVGNLAIVYTNGADGKSLAAYNRETGEPVWFSGHRTDAYGSPQLSTLAGVPQVLLTCSFGMQAFAPETGELLWDYAWGVKNEPRVVQPVVVDGASLLVGTTGLVGTRLLHIEKQDSAWTVQEVWENKKFRPYFNDLVLHKGYCYGYDGDRLVCIEALTGAPKWQGSRYGGQLVLMADMDMLVVLSEKGGVALVPATPEGFSETASFQAISGKTWNHPVVAQGNLFVRNASEMACFELK